ncbi:Caffeic acid 3-O-methyltransferase, partial [Bienertia sinuspersici]
MATTSEIQPNNTNEASICNIAIGEEEEEEETYYTYTSQLVNSFALPMVMKVTINMGVLQLIHDHASPSGLSALEIASRINIPNPNAPVMLDRMLRLLATYLVVGCTTVSTADGGLERRYSSSRVTKFLVVNEDRVSLTGLMNLFMDKILLESWNKLDEALIGGGIPFNIEHGMSIFEYASIDSRFWRSIRVLRNIQQLVDVGGGVGHTLRVITSKYPSIKGINFDLPHVIQNAPPCPGVEHVSGDMLKDIPEGDAIFMK